MNFEIVTTPGQIISMILGTCGAIVTISAAIAVIARAITKAREPNRVQDERIEALEDKVGRIEDRLQLGNRRFEADADRVDTLEKSMKMTKRELVSKVAAKTHVTQEDTRMMLDALLDAIADCLVQGDHICLHQLGTFSVQTIPEHRTNLPGIEVLPETKKVKLKMSSELKSRLN